MWSCREKAAAFILHGKATTTAAVTNQTDAPGTTDVKYDWSQVMCTEIQLVTDATTVAMP
uniref:Uncharacterized protein n=1 Tax=Romanomermis culicivorax TaxID=13658 RepID=A0A915IMX2_ROMCU